MSNKHSGTSSADSASNKDVEFLLSLFFLLLTLRQISCHVKKCVQQTFRDKFSKLFQQQRRGLSSLFFFCAKFLVMLKMCATTSAPFHVSRSLCNSILLYRFLSGGLAMARVKSDFERGSLVLGNERWGQMGPGSPLLLGCQPVDYAKLCEGNIKIHFQSSGGKNPLWVLLCFLPPVETQTHPRWRNPSSRDSPQWMWVIPENREIKKMEIQVFCRKIIAC